MNVAHNLTIRYNMARRGLVDNLMGVKVKDSSRILLYYKSFGCLFVFILVTESIAWHFETLNHVFRSVVVWSSEVIAIRYRNECLKFSSQKHHGTFDYVFNTCMYTSFVNMYIFLSVITFREHIVIFVVELIVLIHIVCYLVSFVWIIFLIGVWVASLIMWTMLKLLVRLCDKYNIARYIKLKILWRWKYS